MINAAVRISRRPVEIFNRAVGNLNSAAEILTPPLKCSGGPFESSTADRNFKEPCRIFSSQ